MKYLLTALLTLTALAGCLTDDTDADAKTGRIIDHGASLVPAAADSIEPLARLFGDDGEAVDGAGGIWVFDDKVYASGLGRGDHGFWIADIKDPENPVLLYQAPADSITPFSRDADIVAHDDGSITLVLATQTDGMHVWDVTDPTAPEFLARVEVNPNHNVATVPGTTFVFNSQSGGEGTTNDLIDLTDPAKPVVAGTYGTHGCHDITFFQDDTRFRAYCAGIDRTEIWNMDGFDINADAFGITIAGTIEGTDSPVVGSPAFGTYPVRTLHHLAIVNNDASVLIIGDEHNGGGSPGTCFFYDETTGLSTPLGALWFYDISDEASPELLSWISPASEGVSPNPANPPGATPNCTAHFGQVIPGYERLVMAWYTAGVLLIDFEDPENPRIIDQVNEDGNVWDARYYNGHIFTGDITRGLDVLRLA